MRTVWTFTWRTAIALAIAMFIVGVGGAGPFSGSSLGYRVGGSLVLAGVALVLGAAFGAVAGAAVAWWRGRNT